MELNDNQFFNLLVLARLRVEQRTAHTPAKLQTALASLLGVDASSLAPPVKAALDACAAAGTVSRDPLALTSEGRHLLLDEFGIPATGKVEWLQIKNQYLMAECLGIEGRQRPLLRESARLRAAVIANTEQLELPGVPTLTQVTDALVWRELGFDISGPLSLNKLREGVLARYLDSEARLDKLQQRLAARNLSAPGNDVNGLRQSLLQRWLSQPEASAPAEACEELLDYDDEAEDEVELELAAEDSDDPELDEIEEGEDPQPLHDSFDLKRFAANVHELAGSDKAERFGHSKVFISSIWRLAKERNSPAYHELDEFKRRLLEANREGELTLCRADSVAAMDADEVAASRTDYLDTSFHFVDVEAKPQ